MSIEYNPVGITCNLGCPYSLRKGTLVLMRDMTWKPIEEISVGENVVGFDEETPSGSVQRKLRTATVTATPRHTGRIGILKTKSREIYCTPDHPWLDKWGKWRNAEDFDANSMRASAIRSLCDAPQQLYESTEEYRIGYLAGVSKGDAHIGSFYRLAVLDEEILDRVQIIASMLNISLSRRVFNSGKSGFMPALYGGIEVVRFITDILKTTMLTSEGRRGFVAGFFDAEGGQHKLNMTQKNRSLLQKIQHILESEYTFSTTWVKPYAKKHSWTLRVNGTISEQIRFWSIFQPCRKKLLDVDGRGWRGRDPIESFKITNLVEEVYDLTTTTGTFIAEGLCSHNCYQTPMRDAANLTKPRDVEKVKKALLDEGGSFTAFGGEALLAPIDHLEEMWKFGFETWGSNGLQTNGVLITPEHVELFKKYNVYPGISLDGPGELNDSRWRGTLETTRQETEKTLSNIDLLLSQGIIPSLIITLYSGNVRNGRLEILKDWFRDLDRKGIKWARLHLLEVDHDDVAETMALTPQENVDAMIQMHDLEGELTQLQFDIFTDMRRLLRGTDDYVTCIWNACDPYTTRAVRGVDANGDQHNCGRTNKDGVNWYKSARNGYERQLALYHTPWKHNGCKGCRFFVMCKGQCPGTGQHMDWRNKSDTCWVWYQLLEYLETKMVEAGESPISLHPRLREIEAFMLQRWSSGNSTSIHQALSSLVRRSSDHKTKQNHVDVHGDGHQLEHIYDEHGDGHGDSNFNDNSGHGDTWK